MLKNIIKDENFLKIPSTPASIDDKQIAIDLVDTLNFHKGRCLGLAANMIGSSKTVLAFYHNNEIFVMYNPTIIKSKESYQTSEGCLSLVGQRETIRFKHIKVSYYNHEFKQRIQTFSGLDAQVIQHEMDHFKGIII